MTIDEAEGDASWCIPDAVKRQAGMRNHCKGQWQHYMIRLGAYYIHGQYVILYHAVHISYTYICDVIGWRSVQYKNKFDQLAALFLVFFLSLFASPVGLLLVVVVVVRLPASQVLFCIFSLRGSRWTPGAGCFTVHRTTNLDEFASLRDLAVFFFLGGENIWIPHFFRYKTGAYCKLTQKVAFFLGWVQAISVRQQLLGDEHEAR